MHGFLYRIVDSSHIEVGVILKIHYIRNAITSMKFKSRVFKHQEIEQWLQHPDRYTVEPRMFDRNTMTYEVLFKRKKYRYAKTIEQLLSRLETKVIQSDHYKQAIQLGLF